MAMPLSEKPGWSENSRGLLFSQQAAGSYERSGQDGECEVCAMKESSLLDRLQRNRETSKLGTPSARHPPQRDTS